MILFRNISEVLTLAPAMAKEGRNIEEKDLGIQKNIEILVSGGLIVWMGPKGKCPKIYIKKIKKEISLKHQTILPGFVECHTHSIFAGSRAAEFELRNQGVSYLDIAKQGGGILSTLKATRKATSQELLKLALSRVEQFVSQGVTTLEIKSGYGLDLKNELKILEVAKKIKSPRVISTFLGAHAIPGEYSSEAEYLDFLVEKVLPQVKKKKLSNRVDIFIEKGFFTKENAKTYLQKAQSMGFQVVIHADQLSLSGGTDLAIEVEAQSADHLICIGDREIQKLAKSQ
ncbi:MAG TPA: imidazolonepropionase, partial [Pseudobdellovibrionaceae bacterium]|nr:imidazolonepropionase [Pseudobdellovibrionaceae bacterium]